MGDYPEQIAEKACLLALECGKERRRVQLFAPEVGHIIHRDETVIKDRNRNFDPKVPKGMVRMVISPGLMAVNEKCDGPTRTGVVSLHPADVYCSALGWP